MSKTTNLFLKSIFFKSLTLLKNLKFCSIFILTTSSIFCSSKFSSSSKKTSCSKTSTFFFCSSKFSITSSFLVSRVLIISFFSSFSKNSTAIFKSKSSLMMSLTNLSALNFKRNLAPLFFK